MSEKNGPRGMYSLIRESAGPPRTRHTVGFPPEIADAGSGRHDLPRTEVLILTVDAETGNAFLVRYTRAGEIRGRHLAH